MARTPPGPPGTVPQSRSQQIAYYAKYVAELKGTYQGSNKQYDGMTWVAMYKSIANAYQAIDPGELADAILGLAEAQRLGENLAGGDAQLVNLINTANAAVPQVVSNLPGVNILSGIGAVGQFFNDLRDPSVWLRAGKIVGGLVILTIGLLKLTGLTEKAGPIAAKAVKAAPFL